MASDLGLKRTACARPGAEKPEPAKRTVALKRPAASARTPVVTLRAKPQFTSTLLPGLTIDPAAALAA